MIENKQIDLSNMVIARKWSYIEWNMHHKHLTEKEFIDYQKSLGINTNAMVESHEQQLKSLEKILNCFDQKPNILVGEVLTKDKLRSAGLVISLGGDDHFKYVSHFTGNQPVLAVNSDPERSEGALTYFMPEDFTEFVTKLFKGEYKVECWPRLQVTLFKPNRPQLRIKQLAISEIYIGAHSRISMSKYNMGSPERHKDSGALIALPSGIGEGSWFNNAGGHFPVPQKFISREENEAWYLSTEIWRGRTLPDAKRIKKFYKGETLEIYYTSYYEGIVSIDPKEGSGRNYKMVMGDRVLIEFADQPINVINKQNI